MNGKTIRIIKFKHNLHWDINENGSYDLGEPFYDERVNNLSYLWYAIKDGEVYDSLNFIISNTEEYFDYGIDGCSDEQEDGNGGCDGGRKGLIDRASSLMCRQTGSKNNTSRVRWSEECNVSR